MNATLMGCRVLEEPGVFPVLLWLQSDENQRYLMSHFLFMAPTRSRFPLQGPPLLPSVIPQTIEQVSAYGSMLLCPPPTPVVGLHPHLEPTLRLWPNSTYPD